MNQKKTEVEMRKDLKVGRVATIGVEGERAHVGKIISIHDNTIELQLIDTDLEMLRSDDFIEYDLDEICDYEFSMALSDMYDDEDGNEYSCVTHLLLFANDWNIRGFFR